MEFLLYLSPIGKQILNQLISAKFHIHENAGICKTDKVFGYVKKPNKFFICTDTIKKLGYDPYVYVNETLYHEAVHATHSCNNGNPIGIPKQRMPLSANKQQDVSNSLNQTKNYKHRDQEHEAYYLEDHPEYVSYYLKKFCF